MFKRWIGEIKRFFTKNLPVSDRQDIEKNTRQALNAVSSELSHSKKQFTSWFYNLAWVKQLSDASQTGSYVPTLVATICINLLAIIFPMMLMQVYDRVIPNHSFETLFFLSVCVIVALVLELIMRISRSYVNLWSDTRYEYELSKTAFTKLMNAPLPVYEAEGAGTRLKQLGILDQLKGFYNNQLLSSVFDIPFVIIFLALIAYLGGWLFLVPLIVLGALSYASFRFIAYWEHTLNEKITHESRESNFVIDVLSNIHTVKSLGMESLMIRRYERLQKTGSEVNYAASVEAGDLNTLKMFASQIVVILIVIFGGIYVIKGKMAIGGLAACTLLVSRIMQPMTRALSAFNRWKMVNVVRQQLDAVLQMPVEEKSTFSDLGQLKGEITFKNMSFRYEDDSPWIFHDVNLTIPAGAIIGVTGHGQSGKTTLLSILATIYTPTSGYYLIDGVDVTKNRTHELRQQIAYLSQQGKLFRGTIMDNLSAFDEKQIPAARRLAELLGLGQVISKLPNGYDTMVGDRAVDSLPRGIVVRMIIVRALAHRPKIILFDEANMNLDAQSDERLMALLMSFKGHATVIIVSHRPSTIAHAEIVYAIENSQLVRVENAKQ
ncbi:MAG TPA: ABC transporter transmembrane domain-containing protein [Coxiellaceae bacterium]|nr:MAG: hypothetical protein A3E81_07285 [Gammaproteobacteria bacterium RIFCSPHIGHO2_12_FULL_36_30]HLB57140.1 ABC transporter transmembrane domain-containing protein [Coxiellaceae bacterium]